MDVFNETYFETNVRNFYQQVDRAFRLEGCEKLGSQDIFFRLSRMANPLIEYSDIKRICADIDALPQSPDEPGGHRRWPLAWGKASKRYKEIGEKAEPAGHKYTSGINFVRASLLAHAGQLFSHPDWIEKTQLQTECINCYQRGAKHLGIEAFLIPFEGHQLPGYLWLPKGVDKPPIVIMVPGANSTKEELHRWAYALVQRGMASFTFDGPGQGELSPLRGSRLPLRLELYHLAISAIIDYLEENVSHQVDLSRLALWGQATGGHLITRAYEYERRPKAILNLDGTPSLKGYPWLPGDLQQEQRDVYGFTNYEETWAYLQLVGDAMQAAKSIDIPYLIINGVGNVLVQEDSMLRLARTVGKTAELLQYTSGNLGVFNWDSIMTDTMADWLLDKLD